MPFVEPSFEIDEKGHVICQFHSNYAFFVKPNKTTLEEQFMEKILTCKSCNHYRENDCFFPKLEINKIEKDQRRGVFLCRLCGDPIHRILTIIHKFYINETYHVNLPLICCDCHENLKKNNLMDNFKQIISEKKYSLLIYFLASIFMFLVSLTLFVFIPTLFLFFLISIVHLIFSVNYLIIHTVKKLYSIYKGNKYFQKFLFSNNE